MKKGQRVEWTDASIRKIKKNHQYYIEPTIVPRIDAMHANHFLKSYNNPNRLILNGVNSYLERSSLFIIN